MQASCSLGLAGFVNIVKPLLLMLAQCPDSRDTGGATLTYCESVTHVNLTCKLQTVGRLYDLNVST